MKRNNVYMLLNMSFICILACVLFVPVISFSAAHEQSDGNLHPKSYYQTPEVQWSGRDIVICINNLIEHGPDSIIYHGFEGYDGGALILGDYGPNTWTFTVEESGYYNLVIDYFALPGRGTEIEMALHINGALPFREAGSVVFKRHWENAGPILTNQRGDDIQPGQVENLAWREQIIRDYGGFHKDPFLIWLDAGENTLSLETVMDNMVVGNMRFTIIPSPISYAQYRALHADAIMTSGFEKRLQAQHAVERSSQALSPTVDRSSQATYPNEPGRHRLNVISGYNWNQTGQWIDWEIEVEEAGLHKIYIRGLQNFTSGISSVRALYVNGELPFAEAGNIVFPHSSRWQIFEVADSNGQPFLFYLQEGVNTLRLEATTGDMAGIITRVSETLAALNAIYRQIVQITGTFPDNNRDYQLQLFIPDALENLAVQRDILINIANDLEMKGGGGESTAELLWLVRTIDQMLDRVDRLPRRVSNFRESLSGLAEWMVAVMGQPLTLDFIMVASPDVNRPRVDNGFFANLWYEIRLFFASFRNDRNFAGDDGAVTESLTVWIGTGAVGGRDQAQVLRQMLDNHFTPQYDIGVNLQLVPAGTLLPALFAGRAPDVALQLSAAEIMNYGLRNALVDVSLLDGYEEVFARFTPQAWVPYSFDGRVFGVPETMTFPMLFFRRDIMEQELGFDMDRDLTWYDILIFLPDILRNNMTMWLAPDMGNFFTFLTQFGSDFYRTDSILTALDTVEASQAFRFFTDFYTAFNLNRHLNFLNWFRTGEAPIGIADYTIANELAIFAPEIRGLWDFMPIPGTIQSDGTFNHSGSLATAGCVIVKQSQHHEKAWEFIKWWTSAEMQIIFAREVEAVLGPAGRFTPANLEAFANMPWSNREYERLVRQMKSSVAVREMPGGYYTSRQITFAIVNVVEGEGNPREVLQDHAMYINQEIKFKARELGIDINTPFVLDDWVNMRDR